MQQPVPTHGEAGTTSGQADRSTLTFFTTGPDETRRLGAALADCLRPGDVLVLTGDLGAGKTCLTQGIGQGLRIAERITSPTFTLANRYRGDHPEAVTLHHLDVYRLETAAEAFDLDLPELQETGVTVVEWGELIIETLAAAHLVVTLTYPDVANGAEGIDRFDDRLISIAVVGETWDTRVPLLRSALAPWADEGGVR